MRTPQKINRLGSCEGARACHVGDYLFVTGMNRFDVHRIGDAYVLYRSSKMLPYNRQAVYHGFVHLQTISKERNDCFTRICVNYLLAKKETLTNNPFEKHLTGEKNDAGLFVPKDIISLCLKYFGKPFYSFLIWGTELGDDSPSFIVHYNDLKRRLGKTETEVLEVEALKLNPSETYKSRSHFGYFSFVSL